MKSIADELPPEIASQINPEWRRNEAEYWAVRDQLLGKYQGQWVGFANGKVIASGSSPVAVFDAAEDSGKNPFVVCVGKESEPTRTCAEQVLLMICRILARRYPSCLLNFALSADRVASF